MLATALPVALEKLEAVFEFGELESSKREKRCKVPELDSFSSAGSLGVVSSGLAIVCSSSRYILPVFDIIFRKRKQEMPSNGYLNLHHTLYTILHTQDSTRELFTSDNSHFTCHAYTIARDK